MYITSTFTQREGMAIFTVSVVSVAYVFVVFAGAKVRISRLIRITS